MNWLIPVTALASPATAVSGVASQSASNSWAAAQGWNVPVLAPRRGNGMVGAIEWIIKHLVH